MTTESVTPAIAATLSAYVDIANGKAARGDYTMARSYVWVATDLLNTAFEAGECHESVWHAWHEALSKLLRTIDTIDRV